MSSPYMQGAAKNLALTLFLAFSIAAAVRSEVPGFKITDGSLRLSGVGPDNPLIYDNDWWFDVFDNNYLWARASLGDVDLRGNIVTRDMWDWQKGYHYSMDACVKDARKALDLARRSGLENIPDLTSGSDRVLVRPDSGRIEDTEPHPTAGSRLIVAEARRAKPDKPLLIISGGPLTTVANAVLTNPEIAPNLVVFNLTVSSHGYNGKDVWSPYIVAKRTRLVDWATGAFWKKNSVFRAEHFESLPKNPFCDDMRRLIKSGLGQANQLGDGAPLVWLWRNACWKGAKRRRAVWTGKYVKFEEVQEGEAADVLDIPREQTDIVASREEFFSVLARSEVYSSRERKKGSPGRRRVVILTDMSNEPDDQMSLVRFLLYSNEFDVEGLVATTSCWKKEDPDLATIRRVIGAYEKVRPNLLLHSPHYPTADHLRSVTRSGVSGYGMEAAAKQLDNEAIALILSVLEKDDPRPVWFCAWGRGNTLGGAVMKLLKERPDDAARLVKRIRGYEIALQDEGWAYIARRFPETRLISARVLWKGISRTTKKFNAWPESRGGNNAVFSAEWIKRNVQEGHGPLGEEYPSADYLWEGDTPSFLYLLPNGLSFPERIGYGGWGGRFDPVRQVNVRSGTGNKTVDPLLDHHRDYRLYSDAVDAWSYRGTEYRNGYASVFRWREAFQNDFAARMDWCLASRDMANHAPIPVVNGHLGLDLVELGATSGQELELDARGSRDPDGDGLTYRWWVYPEPGSYRGKIAVQGPEKSEASLVVPRDAGGKDFHVILNVTDDGTPRLTRYRRIVVSVE